MTKQILTLGIVLSSMVLSGCAAYNNLRTIKSTSNGKLKRLTPFRY